MPISVNYRGLLKPAAILIPAALLVACPQRTAIWIEPGSTINHLVFRMGAEYGQPGGAQFGAIRVYRCDAPDSGPGADWVVGPVGGTAPITALVYGEVPSGFISDQGPMPLRPGCYRVGGSGTGSTSFDIDSTGHVTENRTRL